MSDSAVMLCHPWFLMFVLHGKCSLEPRLMAMLCLLTAHPLLGKGKGLKFRKAKVDPCACTDKCTYPTKEVCTPYNEVHIACKDVPTKKTETKCELVPKKQTACKDVCEKKVSFTVPTIGKGRKLQGANIFGKGKGKKVALAMPKVHVSCTNRLDVVCPAC